MLEPENNQPVYQSSLLDEETKLNNFDRANLNVAGGWSIFLGGVILLTMLYSGYNFISSLSSMRSAYFSIFDSTSIITIVIGFAINIFLIYWYFVFGNAARQLGEGGSSRESLHKMSAGVLALFRFWGIFLIIIIIFYAYAILSDVL
ncbi:MAG: hypothetical protein AAF433_12015 [Bacteroidota bacterium]